MSSVPRSSRRDVMLPAWLLGLSHLGGAVGTAAEVALLVSGSYVAAAVAVGPLIVLAVVVLRAGIPRPPRGRSVARG